MGFSYNINRGIYNRCNNLSGTETFFIDIPDKRETTLQAHRNEIKKIYKNWQLIEFNRDLCPLGIDLDIFHPEHRMMQIIEQIIPAYHQQNRKRQTIDEMALCHLNCKDEEYSEIYKKYLEISKCQDDFNIKMSKFIGNVREHLKTLTDIHDNSDRVESLLRFYLYKIAHASKFPNDVQYHLNRLDPVALINSNETLYNPSKEQEENIKQDLNSEYSKIINQFNYFKNDIKMLTGLITDFVNSFDSIIANDIKGTCSIEKQLTFTGRIKSVFHLC